MKTEESNIFAELLDSVRGFQAYGRFAEQKAGRVMLYLLVLTLLCGSIAVIRPARGLERGIKEAAASFQKRAPGFMFKNGTLLFEGKKPITITEGEHSIIVMDSTGKTDVSVLDRYEKGVYLARNRIYYKKSAAETRMYNLNNLNQFSFDKSDVLSLFGRYRVVTVVFVFLYMLWFYIGKLFSAFILAVIGLIFCGIKGGRVDFPGLYAMGVHALTLPVILDTAVSAAGIAIPYSILIYYLVAAVYLWKGVSLFGLKTVQTGVPR